MSELKIKLRLGDFEIEIEGEKDIVQKEFNSLKENGLGELFNSVPVNVSLNNTPETKPKTVETEAVLSKKSKSEPKKEKKGNSVKKKSASAQSYSMLADLNLRTSEGKSLEDYYNSFVITTNMERNITILYYLKKILEIENVGPNHIYTCYKKVGVKIPNIYQGLIDTKNRKGWIETHNMEDLQVSVSGENYIEHEAPKKDSK
jgi:hypothetical protein